MRTLVCLSGISLLLVACGAGATPQPAPGLDPTDFLATRVPQVLTENAATLAVTWTSAPPSATASPTPTPTPSQEATPTPEPSSSATPTLGPSPYPTVGLWNFPAPPPAFGGDPHFYFGRPIGAGGNVFVAASYRYGSTSGNRFDTHHGVEFGNPAGVPIVAVAPGTVFYAGADLEQAFGPTPNFYGNLVVLQLAQPWLGRIVYALYGHMNEIIVQTGQPVAAGELLGTVGSSGIARGAHLHLEVRIDHPQLYSETRNPELWLAPINRSHGTVAVRVTNELNQYLPGMRVNIECSDGAARFVDTYWDSGPNPDDIYGENAALTDVPAGPCRLETAIEGKKVEASVVVVGNAVTFVWLHP